MAIDPYALIATVGEVKTYLGITGTSDDERLSNLVNECSKIIESYIDRKIKRRKYIEYYDGDGISGVLHLNHYPVAGVSALYDDPSRTFTDSYLIATSDYVVYKEEGIIKLVGDTLTGADYVFAKSRQGIKVIYSAGYGTVPYDLQLACKEFVAHEYKKVQERRFGISSRSVRGTTESFEKFIEGIPESIKAMIQPYRRFGL